MTPRPVHGAADVARSRRYGAWYVAEHLLRGVRAFLAVWAATLLGTPFLYVLAFGVGLGTLLTRNEAFHDLTGVGYLQFVAPALVVNASVLLAVDEFMFGILQGFLWNKHFFAMNAAPLTPRQIVDGMFLYVGIRVLATAIVYFGIVALFGAALSPAAVLVVPAALLAAYAFGAIAAYSSSITEDRSQFNVVYRLVVMPLTLFSGTVFPLSQLPIFLQWIGWVSPIWHASELGRQASYGAGPNGMTLVHLVVLVAFAVAGWRLTVRVAARRLNS